MGCSPSKGNNFGVLGPMRKGRMLPPAPQESSRDSHFDDAEKRSSTGSTDVDTKERKAAGQTQVLQKEARITPQKKRYVTEPAPEAVNMDKAGSQGMDNNTVSQKKDKNVDKHDAAEKKPARKQKKNTRGVKGLKKKDKEKSPTEQKVDFPEPLNAGAKTKVVCSPKTSRRQWTDEERSPRRPQTTAPTRKAAVKKTPVSKERRSQSEESLRSKAEDPTLLELERTQKDLDQRLQRMGKSKPGGNMKTTPPKQNQGTSPAQSPAKNRKHPSLQKNSNSKLIDDKAVLTRRNSKKLEAASVVEDDKLKDKKTSKGPIKATPPPSPPASPRPPSGLYRGRKSVKRLIDTFSQGIEDLEVPKSLGPLIGVRKFGVPVLPGLGNVEAVLSTGITSCRPDSRIVGGFLCLLKDLDPLSDVAIRTEGQV
ncbi:hypothetical protein NQZ68_017512 [Dissostichus eleginoides]|nr:hypothetical protein NQZ68_017512 [Dissostichus eleginoides]